MGTLKQIAAAAGLAFAAGWLVPALAAVAHGGATTTIDISKFAFAPKEIEVKPGTTIAWINRDETPHTILANGAAFKSKAMDTDDRYEYTFEREGDYSYFCTLHPFMTGIVHVRK